mgnify:CR=1 FL=1
MATTQLLVRIALMGHAVALLALVLLVYDRHGQREERIAQDLLSHAQLFAAAAAERIGAVERQLQRLALEAPADATQAQDFLRDVLRVQEVEGIEQVVLTTPAGVPLLETREPQASWPWEVGRQAGPVLTVPVAKANGVSYVLRTSVPPSRLLSWNVPVPPGWSVAVADPQGAVRANWPELRLYPAVSVDEGLAQAMRRRTSGVVAVRTGHGDASLAAFSRIDAEGWTSVVSVPRSELHGSTWRITALEALAAALLLTAAGGTTLRFASRTGTLLDQRLLEAQRSGVTSDRRLRSILSLEKDAIVISDAGDRVVLVNDAAKQMFASDGRSLLGTRVEELLTIETWAQCLSGRGHMEPVAGHGRRADGSPFPIDYTVSYFADARGRLFRTMVVTDTSARQQEDDAFGRALDKEAENRQAALARELHDAVGSALAGVSLMLGSAYSFIRDPQAAALISKSQEQVMLASQQVRQIARGIMPAGQERGALLAALEQFAADLSAVPGVRCTVRSRGDFSAVPPEVGGHLYRIVQEATSNALRHGQALRVRITLVQVGTWCRMTVCDYGTGVRPASGAGLAEGLGMKSMRARAEAIGGRFAVVTSPGHPLKVQVTWLCSLA